jgi:serine/threonine protein phosphatase PrpC
VLVSDGVTEALDGMPLEDSVWIPNGHRATAAELCDRFMAEALAGPGPSGDSEWDDDRTVVVLTVRDAHLGQHMVAPVGVVAEEDLRMPEPPHS